MKLDTTISTDPPAGSEVDMLLFAMDRSRAQFAWKCGGLDAAGLSYKHGPTDMTIGGLLLHLAAVENYYLAAVQGENPVAAVEWDSSDGGQPEWRLAASKTPDEIYALWQGAVDRARVRWPELLADGAGVPSKYQWPDGQTLSLRRVIVDLHDEYARHVGHADLIREAIDGLVGEDPPQQ